MDWHTIWFHYVYGSLLGNGPEAVIEILVLAALGRLLWPRIKRELHKGDAELHAKLEHLRKHLDLPPFEHKEHP